jgi:hypothetical protein
MDEDIRDDESLRQYQLEQMMGRWRAKAALARKKAKEEHDRILETYGIETRHELADVEDPNTYTDEYDYLVVESSENDATYRITGTTKHLPNDSLGKRLARKYCSGYDDELEFQHLAQDENWKPKLIGEEDGLYSPYKLTEQEQVENAMISKLGVTKAEQGDIADYLKLIEDVLNEMDANRANRLKNRVQKIRNKK